MPRIWITYDCSDPGCGAFKTKSYEIGYGNYERLLTMDEQDQHEWVKNKWIAPHHVHSKNVDYVMHVFTVQFSQTLKWKELGIVARNLLK